MESLCNWTTNTELLANSQNNHELDSSCVRKLLSNLTQLARLCVLPKPNSSGLQMLLPTPKGQEDCTQWDVWLASAPCSIKGMCSKAQTSLLQSTPSMAVYGTSIAQLSHHHLPPSSWWAAAMIKQEYLNWK